MEYSLCQETPRADCASSESLKNCETSKPQIIGKLEDEDVEMKAAEPKEIVKNVAVSSIATARTLDDEFILKQFNLQREITASLLQKLKITENLATLIRDQQSQILSLVGLFTKFEKEFKELKSSVDELYNEESFDEEEEEESEGDEDPCPCCKDDDDGYEDEA